MACPLLLSYYDGSIGWRCMCCSLGGSWVVSSHVRCIVFKLSFCHDYALFNNGSIFGEPVFALVGVFVFPVFEWCLEHILVTYKYIGLVCIQGLDLLE